MVPNIGEAFAFCSWLSLPWICTMWVRANYSSSNRANNKVIPTMPQKHPLWCMHWCWKCLPTKMFSSHTASKLYLALLTKERLSKRLCWLRRFNAFSPSALYTKLTFSTCCYSVFIKDRLVFCSQQIMINVGCWIVRGFPHPQQFKVAK